MTAAAKLKVSLTLSADLIALVDRDARRGKGSRSGVIEQWLRRAANASVQHEIDDATAVYYRSLRDDDGTKDEACRALSRMPPAASPTTTLRLAGDRRDVDRIRQDGRTSSRLPLPGPARQASPGARHLAERPQRPRVGAEWNV